MGIACRYRVPPPQVPTTMFTEKRVTIMPSVIIVILAGR